jgi:thioredoxin reductase
MTSSLRRRTRVRSRRDDGRWDRGAAVSHRARAEIGRPVLDALVVGGGPAGLSAALVLGRARRRVLVLDTGRPANGVSDSVGGLLARGGVSPIELRRAGRAQLGEYTTVELRCDEVLDAQHLPGGFAVSVDGDDAPVRTRALVIAHGLRYKPPRLPGIEGLWGRSVFHCPFCDGWEVRDRPVALHGNGPAAGRSALLVAGWSGDVVLLTDGPAELDGERAALARAGVRVREEPILRLAGRDGRLERIEFAAGPAEDRDALFVSTRRGQPNGLAAALGCSLTEGGTIETDIDGRTGVPGVYAAGDTATEHSRSVANAIGSGSRVGYAVALDPHTINAEHRTPAMFDKHRTSFPRPKVIR